MFTSSYNLENKYIKVKTLYDKLKYQNSEIFKTSFHFITFSWGIFTEIWKFTKKCSFETFNCQAVLITLSGQCYTWGILLYRSLCEVFHSAWK